MRLLNKSLSYWLRVIHRDLGFLMVGLCLVYGVSGFLLNHMDGKILLSKPQIQRWN